MQLIFQIRLCQNNSNISELANVNVCAEMAQLKWGICGTGNICHDFACAVSVLPKQHHKVNDVLMKFDMIMWKMVSYDF